MKVQVKDRPSDAHMSDWTASYFVNHYGDQVFTEGPGTYDDVKEAVRETRNYLMMYRQHSPLKEVQYARRAHISKLAHNQS